MSESDSKIAEQGNLWGLLTGEKPYQDENVT
jgi:hypothetical protein